jgi:hypothetical protein
MADYEGRTGVVSNGIGLVMSKANKKVPHSAPVASSFLDKEMGFEQPFMVPNNTSYSKPRPTGNFENPKKYNYVPLNITPSDCVNELNAPLVFPSKLHYQDTDNRFMDTISIKSGVMEPHRSEMNLECLVRPN